MKNKKNHKSILKDYMRMAYEEFGYVLINELIDKHPKDFKLHSRVEKTVKSILTKEFGKETGCDLGFGD
jgi:hypothetical protein